ncbi:MAG: hypothetical protein ACOC7U_07205 [Spirochaetota bacterium]
MSINENFLRWYDTYLDLRSYIDRLRDLDKKERERIIDEIYHLITSYDENLIDEHVLSFPMSQRRRWYDKDPYSWMVINGLKYADERLLDKIVDRLRQKL